MLGFAGGVYAVSDQEIQKVYDKLEELRETVNSAIYIGNGKPAIISRLDSIENWIKQQVSDKAARVDWFTWAFRLVLLIILYKMGFQH